MVKLAVVCGHLPAKGGNQAVMRARRYATLCQRFGYETDLLGLAADVVGGAPQTSEEGGLKVTRAPVGPTQDPRFSFWQALMRLGPFHGILALQIGVTGQPAAMAGRLWRMPVMACVTGHDVVADLFDPMWMPFVQLALSQATAVAAATLEMAELVKPFRADQQVAIWPEVLAEGAGATPPSTVGDALWSAPPGKPRIGTVGAPRLAEGLLETLLAFQQVHRRAPQAQLILMGVPAADARPMVELWTLENPGPAQRVFWIPDLGADLWPTYFGWINQLWLPWHRDGFHSPLLTAMACGVPTVATGVGAHGELLRDGVNALVVPARQVDPLADAALRLAQHETLARDLGAAAKTSLPATATPAAEQERLVTMLRQVGLMR